MKEERARRTLAALRAGTAAPEMSEAAGQSLARERRLARMAWALERIDALRRAQAALDAAWMKQIEPYADWDEEDLPELDDPSEQAEVDRILAELDDVRYRDRWPRHLHWGEL